MAHPVYKVDGKRVPSVTTVLSRFKDSGGLIHWAWQQGMEGLDYRQTRDAAADAGTLAHSMVEAHIHGKEMPAISGYDNDTWTKAMSCYEAFKDWSRQTQLQPLETEVSLTCDCHMLGGTLDAMLIQGTLAIGDWKTSNGVYVEMLCQLAAYGHLWTINHPDRPVTGGYHLLRFSKGQGDFTHHYWADLSVAWRQFELFRNAYDNDKLIKQRL